MVRTRVGYAGGTTANPTYRNIGDHSETIQIDYDPDRISYEELLKVFWDNHSPTMQPWSRQYRSVIFYHSDEQRQLALATRQREEARLGRAVLTEIVPYSVFHLAEDYHQKYYLQQMRELIRQFHAVYPDISDFMDSTVAARINGLVGGYGSLESLKEQPEFFGMSPVVSSRLLDIGRKRLPSASCGIGL
ncbi:MAG: peptide-methionine (S)-S-oxide reductase [Dehalococcoidales bacterium]|nr:MAG: peptide-methionine (S)-S-oxide reductase [Dehalococcoidales bacterium]